ncbi:hypothetical protein [Actinoplanes sp. NPDC051859]|uniref:hypothetical protein n=1 Tax=Actinoplanes sp. NPDC051859 TaxID=3363909 RepID=UPI0037ABAB7B
MHGNGAMFGPGGSGNGGPGYRGSINNSPAYGSTDYHPAPWSDEVTSAAASSPGWHDFGRSRKPRDRSPHHHRLAALFLSVGASVLGLGISALLDGRSP